VIQLDGMRLRGQILMIENVRVRCSIGGHTLLPEGYLHYTLEKPLVLRRDFCILSYNYALFIGCG